MRSHTLETAARLLLGLGLIIGAGAARAVAMQEHGDGHAAPAAAAHSPEAGHAPAGHGAEAGHGGGGQPNILAPQPSLAIYTVIVFLALLAILGKYAWKPIVQALEAREHRLELMHREAELARSEAASLLAKHQQQMTQATEQVRAILDEARRNAQSTADDIVKRAQGEAETAKQRAERDINSAKEQALAELWTKSADMAVDIAGRVLSREINETDHKRLVENALRDLPVGPNGSGARG